MATTCFPLAQGVPGQPGAPNWWDGASARPVDTTVDDPRWRGAFAHSFGDGAGVQAMFRGLNYVDGGTNLYLSWLVLVDPIVTSGADRLYVGLTTGAAGAAAIMVEIQLATASATSAGTSGAAYSASVQVLPSGGSWTPSGTTPAWIANSTRAWVDTAALVPRPTLPVAWAVEMEVPIGVELSPDAGNSVILSAGAANSFKMWYWMLVNTMAESGTPLVEYPWPGTSTAGATRFADVSTWAGCHIPSGADPACTATGVSIGVLDVGVENLNGTSRDTPPDPKGDSSSIRLDLTNVPPTLADNDHSNLFFARPQFPAGASNAEKADLLARFRLANWGIHIFDSPSWASIPNGENVAYQVANGECRFQWPTSTDLTQADTAGMINDFRSGAKTLHQCMLVDLSSTWPGGETFLNTGLVRNMNIVNASRYSQMADVDPRSPSTTSGVPTDIYLYLETINMPAQVPAGDGPGVNAGRGFEHMRAAVARRGEGGPLGLETALNTVPVTRVHGYYDTGETTDVLGDTRSLLRPMSSFAHIVEHQGPLTGWQALLQGASRISNDLYLLQAQTDVAKINVTVHALEPGDQPDPEPPIVPYPPGDTDDLRALLLLLNQIIEEIEALLGVSLEDAEQDLRVLFANLTWIIQKIQALTGADPGQADALNALLALLQQALGQMEGLLSGAPGFIEQAEVAVLRPIIDQIRGSINAVIGAL